MTEKLLTGTLSLNTNKQTKFFLDSLLFYCSCIQLPEVQLVGTLCSVFSRAHKGSAGGLLLLQRFSVGLAVDSSSYSHLRVDSWFLSFL